MTTWYVVMVTKLLGYLINVFSMQCSFQHDLKHYHLEVQANPKNGTKKPILFLASMGETGLSYDIFFKFSVRAFEVVEVE